MRCIFILLFLPLFAITESSAQTYVMFGASLSNTAGTIPDKSNLAIEIGRQWEAFSLGLDVGRTSLAPLADKDTALYVELRPNLNVFQQGKFTNTLTTGIGYIIGAKMSLLTELTSGIEYAYSDRFHFNTYFGQYYYSGRYDADNATYFGVSIMFYFLPTKHTALFHKGG